MGLGVTEAAEGDLLLQECPSGLVDEDTFKLIYAQFFPQGGESQARPLLLLLPMPPLCPCDSSAEGGYPFMGRGPSPHL